MSMWYTENQNNLELVLKKFNQAVEKRFEEHGGASSYEVGYLHSTLIHYIKFLPKTKQKELIRDFVNAAKKQEERRNPSLDKDYLDSDAHLEQVA